MSSSKKSAGCPAPVSYGTDANESPARLAKASRTWLMQLQAAIDLLEAAHAAYPSCAEGVPARQVMHCVNERLYELQATLESDADALVNARAEASTGTVVALPKHAEVASLQLAAAAEQAEQLMALLHVVNVMARHEESSSIAAVGDAAVKSLWSLRRSLGDWSPELKVAFEAEGEAQA